MTCATCGAKDANGLVSITKNVHERVCCACAAAWDASPEAHVFGFLIDAGDGAGALRLFRDFQRERGGVTHG